MGIKLIFKSADFSANAVQLPTQIDLSLYAQPDGYYLSRNIVVGTTVLDDVFTSNTQWESYKVPVDINSYSYESPKRFFYMGSGILMIAVLDSNGVVIDMKTKDVGIDVCPTFVVNKETHPNASYIVLCRSKQDAEVYLTQEPI